MINEVSLVGVVLRVSIPERYKNDERYSPVLIVQYGAQREMKRGQSVHFVNAVPVKVIAPKWQMVKDQIKEGVLIQVQGHIQGLVREEDDYRKPGIELVADRINVVEFREVVVTDPLTGARQNAMLPAAINVARRVREARAEAAVAEGAEAEAAAS